LDRPGAAAAVRSRPLRSLHTATALIYGFVRTLSPTSKKKRADRRWHGTLGAASPARAALLFRPRIVHGAHAALRNRIGLPTLRAVRPAPRRSRIDGEPQPHRRRMRRAAPAAIVRRLRRNEPAAALARTIRSPMT